MHFFRCLMNVKIFFPWTLIGTVASGCMEIKFALITSSEFTRPRPSTFPKKYYSEPKQTERSETRHINSKE